ncbi:unnamed protein product [Didymodactylos carnosus]|uniref:Uncharacterized protein n=2 Tax=Didymodactylos carnosus TaxID=1234261 RepID=A0A815EXD3_9BILA|nr:unnamed protein product [Didymodactylos carnosus]CAF4161398.1 unnamed protein product [Didymodactylos carnosus]
MNYLNALENVNLETVENLLKENAQIREKLDLQESKTLRLKREIEILTSRLHVLEDEIDTYEQETSDLRQQIRQQRLNSPHIQ